MTSHKNCPIFKTTSLLHCPATSKILPPPWPWAFGRPISNESTLLLQIITCQLKENLIQGWLWYVVRSSLRVGFCFQYQLINLAWLSTDFFPFSWIQPRPQSYFKKVKTSFLPSSYSEKVCWGQGWAESWLSAFSWLHILVCAVVQKYYEIFFIYNFSHFWYAFCNQPDLFAHLENVNKLWNNNLTVHVNERNQNKNKATSRSNWPRVLLFDVAHKQCNGVIKGWLHCLTSESKGRFLVNNILLAWSLVIAQAQFFLMKKNKDWTSRTLANPLPSTPLRPITSYFCLTPHPSQSGRHMCITPIYKRRLIIP